MKHEKTGWRRDSWEGEVALCYCLLTTFYFLFSHRGCFLMGTFLFNVIHDFLVSVAKLNSKVGGYLAGQWFNSILDLAC